MKTDKTQAANGLHQADSLQTDKRNAEPDTKGKPGAGAGPVGTPEQPAKDRPDVDAGSQ